MGEENKKCVGLMHACNSISACTGGGERHLQFGSDTTYDILVHAAELLERGGLRERADFILFEDSVRVVSTAKDAASTVKQAMEAASLAILRRLNSDVPHGLEAVERPDSRLTNEQLIRKSAFYEGTRGERETPAAESSGNQPDSSVESTNDKREL